VTDKPLSLQQIMSAKWQENKDPSNSLGQWLKDAAILKVSRCLLVQSAINPHI